MKTLRWSCYIVLSVIFISGLLISCKKSDSSSVPQVTGPVITDIGTSTGTATDTTIGSSGGTLRSSDGKLTVTIPVDALAAATKISIQPITNNSPLGLGLGYRLLPEGTVFIKPVQLTFHYDTVLLKESPEDFLWIVTQASDRSWNAVLKSVLDKNAKTVTITTTHFSDWSLGKFLDFSLNPSSSTIQVGQSLRLGVSGFVREKDPEELVPLIYTTVTTDGLDILTPLPSLSIENRLKSFRIKQWTMNGVVAPVSNSHGSLNPSGNLATYTAPNQVPANNPVAVSVQLETKDEAGSSAAFFLISNIRVVDNGYYLLVKIDGHEYKYFQDDTIFNTRINCFVGDGHFQIIADMDDVSTNKNIFTLAFSDPSVTTRILNGPTGDNSNLSFWPSPELEYTLNYEQRTLKADSSCVREERYGNATATLTEYTGAGAIVRGYFSGTLNEDNLERDAQCKLPIAHSIEGEFWLMINLK